MKIFNLNCWLLPPPLSTDNSKRLSQIISLIKNTEPDIISLQEVWLNKYVNTLKKELKNYFFISSEKTPYNKSGLVTGLLTNKPSRQYFFPTNRAYSLVEKIARKGFQVIQLSKDIHFVNTHLYAPKNNREKEITKSQFILLQGVIGSEKCILSGDLNLNEEELIKANNIFSLTKKTINLPANQYQKSRLNKRFKYDNTDYVLKTKTFKTPISTTYLKSPILSDHFVIIGKVKL